MQRSDVPFIKLTLSDSVYIRTFGAGVLSFVQKILWVATLYSGSLLIAEADTECSLRTLNFLTYNAVVSLQNRIPAQLDRCWTQKPVILEDALGRVTPFHLEFIDSWEVTSIDGLTLIFDTTNITDVLGFSIRSRSPLSAASRTPYGRAWRIRFTINNI